MAMQAFTVADFSGGLVTSVDETLLRSSESSDVLNVELLDSGAIKRRKGYLEHSTILAGSEVNLIVPFVNASSIEYTVAMTATTVYSTTTATSVWERHEAEDLTYSATFGTETTMGLNGETLSSGKAVYCTASVHLSGIPSYKSVRVKGRFKGGTLRIDSGSNQAMSSDDIYTFTGLTATAHTLHFNAGQHDDYCGQIDFFESAVGSATARRNLDAHVANNIPVGVHVRIGDGDNWSNLGYIQVTWKNTDSGDNVTAEYYKQSGSTWKLKVYKNGALITTLSPTWADTDLEQWNDTTFTNGTTLGTVDWGTLATYADADLKIPGGVDKVSVYAVNWYGVASQVLYVDNLHVDDVVYESFSEADPWTSWTHYGEATFTRGSQHVEQSFGHIDYIEGQMEANSWTRIGALSASAELYSAASFSSTLYFGTDVDALKKYTGGSSFSTVATAPMPGNLVEQKRRLYSSGSYDDPALIEWSVVDDAEDWVTTASGAGALRPTKTGAGAASRSLHIWRDRLYDICDRRVYEVNISPADMDNWTVSLIQDRYGTIAPRSAVTAPNGIIFLAPGPMVVGYGFANEFIQEPGFVTLSDRIKPTLQALDQTKLDKACAAWFDGKYWLAVPSSGGTGNDIVLIYKPKESGSEIGAWTRYEYDGINITTFAVRDGADYALFAGTSDGKLLRLEYTESDAETPISMRYRFAPFAPNGYSSGKTFLRTHISAVSPNSQSLTVTPTTDDVDGLSQSMTVGPWTNVQPKRLMIMARGRALTMTLESDGLEQPLTVTQVTHVIVPDVIR